MKEVKTLRDDQVVLQDTAKCYADSAEKTERHFQKVLDASNDEVLDITVCAISACLHPITVYTYYSSGVCSSADDSGEFSYQGSQLVHS